MATLDTDISIAPPKGTYVPIAPHSGLAHQHKLHALAGVIDADYRSAIKVMLQNMGTDPVTITQGQCIAQLVCKQAQLPSVLVTDQLEATKQNEDTLGSTERRTTTTTNCTTTPQHITTNIVPFDNDEVDPVPPDDE